MNKRALLQELVKDELIKQLYRQDFPRSVISKLIIEEVIKEVDEPSDVQQFLINVISQKAGQAVASKIVGPVTDKVKKFLLGAQTAGLASGGATGGSGFLAAAGAFLARTVATEVADAAIQTGVKMAVTAIVKSVFDNIEGLDSLEDKLTSALGDKKEKILQHLQRNERGQAIRVIEENAWPITKNLIKMKLTLLF